MNAGQIRAIALDSAKNYYQYLDDNKKGTQEVDVFEIEYPDSKDLIIKLRLSAKLFDQESIFFRLLTTAKTYDNALVKIIEYDSDKNVLLIKPGDLVKKDFENLKKKDIKVISDLKFLVKRVAAWYEKNGASVSLPITVSTLSNTIDKIKFLKGLNPSANQVASLNNLFAKPFTYVWGAPGTGKTQFVLAYAILHYIRNKKRVAILAPTNNSIEQVLRGVLKMTDQAGIDRKQIIRLGTPSRNFAEQFPEVCEEKGIQKRLDEIDKQIKILEKVITYNQKEADLELSRKLLSTFDNFPPLKQKHSLAKTELGKATVIKDRKLAEIDVILADLKNEQLKRQRAQIAIDKIGHKIKKFFTSSETLQEKVLKDIELNIFTIQKNLQKEKQLMSRVQKEFDTKSFIVKQVVDEINTNITLVKNEYNKINGFNNYCSKLSLSNWENVKKQINDSIETQKLENLIDQQLLEGYKHHSVSELQSLMDVYLISRDKLSTLSTKERLVSVNVIACTLDGYIGKFVDEKMKVDHIFLDEAGYANIVKALTLFNHPVPITFLGDHKQLPPVCEINDDKISREQIYNNIFIWSQSAIYIDSIFHKTRDEALLEYLNNQLLNPISLEISSLNATYRFGANLASILGNHVYDQTFTSNNPDGETQLYHIHAAKTDEYKSRISKNEVEEITRLVNNIKRNGNEDFIILTPYKKQVKLLGKNLPEEQRELKILTVHGSQGREWHTVILSVVDTSDKWFVDSRLPISKGLNLINTAVSRAKYRLIIVCDTNYWFDQPGQLITDLIRNGFEYR